jgi:sulfonate transport system substrate-binding protein
MITISRRVLLAGAAALALPPVAALAAEPLKELRIDWATYNPVSLVLKQKGLLEKEFAKDGISITWVQSAGSNKALEFLNAGSIDFGSTAARRRWSPGSTATRSNRSMSIRGPNGRRW